MNRQSVNLECIQHSSNESFWALVPMTSVCIGLFSVIAFFMVNADSLFAKSMEDDVKEFESVMSQTTMMAPMEGAGSHGSIGFGLGLGVAKVDVSESNLVLQDQLRTRDEFSAGQDAQISGSVMAQRAYFHKGFMLPVDVGGSLGRIPGTNATTAGVYVQQTLFERLALPAVAIRGKFSRLMGLPSTEYQVTGAEIAASYGFLMAFNVYGTYGLNVSQSLIRTSGESGTGLTLTSGDSTDYANRQSFANSSVGLQLNLWPWLTTVTAESQSIAGTRSWLGKVSVGL